MHQLTGRSISVLALLAVAVGMFTWCARTQAQGTMNQLPDPINSKQLTLFLERYVDPTFDQWIAIEEAQDVYFEDFAQLRDGEIARFLKETMGSMQGGMPSREQIANYVEELEEVNKRIRRLDTAFFESIARALREDQIPGLERARLARERVRLRSGVSGQMGIGMSMDVWQCIERAKLEEEQLELIDPELREYEQQLTKLLRKWNKQSGETMITMFDELEARGFGDMDMSDPTSMDPEQMQAYMQAIQESFKAALEKSGKEAAKSRELNARTISKICDLLGGNDAWNLKRKYVDDTSIWGRARMTQGWTSNDDFSGPATQDMAETLKRLMEEDALPDEMRDRLRALREAYIAEDDRRLDQVIKGMKEIDPMDVMMESMVAMNSNDSQVEVELSESALRMQEVAALLDKRNKSTAELQEVVVLTVEELEGPEFERIRLFAKGIIGAPSPPDLEEASMEDFDTDVEDVRHRSWIITAMDIRDLSRLREQIGCEDWQYVILESLHEEYLKDWRESVGALQRAIADKGYEAASDPKVMNETNDARARAMAVARELDEAFFDNLLLAMSEEAAVVIHVARIDRMYEHVLAGMDESEGINMSWGQFAVERAENPVRILLDMDMTPETRSAVLDAILLDSEKFMLAAQAVLDQRYENHIRMEGMMQIFAGNDGEAEEFDSERWEKWQVVAERNEQALAPLVAEAEKQRDRLFQAVAAVMPSETQETFETTWKHRSYPGVYKDRSNALTVLRRARGLGTVSQEQIARILALEVEFEVAWNELCDRMIKLSKESTRMTDWQDAEARAAMMDRMARIERVQFQREELGVRTLRRLARLLDEEQRSRIQALRTLGDQIGETSSREGTSTVIVQ